MDKTLARYREFKKNFKFDFKQIEKNENGLFVDGICIEDKNGKNIVFETDTFINAAYGARVGIARLLSNLFPYQFKFRGKKVASIEGILQGIKYKDIKTQNLVLNYSGADAYYVRTCNSIDFWGDSGILYWQGKEIKRESGEYQLFIDELYISALKNPLYKRALLASGNKYILHHIGRDNPKETVLTRYELESTLACLRAFLISEK